MLKKILFSLLTISSSLYASIEEVPMKGELNSNVSVVMFGDYQCPFTQRGNAIINALLKDGVDFSLSVKQMPLSFHPSARLASKAALCAGVSGKYWEMHDLLFASNQREMSAETIEKLADKLDLREVYSKCMAGPDADKIIDRDLAEAKKLSIMGTPAFVITGPRGTRTVAGAYPKEEIIRVMDTLR